MIKNCSNCCWMGTEKIHKFCWERTPEGECYNWRPRNGYVKDEIEKEELNEIMQKHLRN